MGAGKRLAAYTYVLNETGDPVWFGPEDTVPGWAAKKIDNPDAWVDGDSDGDTSDEVEPDDSDDTDDEDADEAKPYAEWLKADLEAEVDARNEDREDDDLIEVDAPGNKAELIAALEADDTAHAG